MWLKKSFGWKGFAPEAWKITSLMPNIIANTTQVTLNAWKDEANLNLGLDQALPMQKTFTISGIFLNEEEIYDAVMAVVTMEQVQTVPAVYNTTTGQLITPAQYGQQDTNIFHNAILVP